MQDPHNVIIGFLSGVPAWFFGLALFVASTDIPGWLYALTAIVVPVLVGLGGKGIDIAYREWVRRRELEEFSKRLEIGTADVVTKKD